MTNDNCAVRLVETVHFVLQQGEKIYDGSGFWESTPTSRTDINGWPSWSVDRRKNHTYRLRLVCKSTFWLGIPQILLLKEVS